MNTKHTWSTCFNSRQIRSLSMAIVMLLAGSATQAASLYSSGAKTWDTATANWGTAASGPYTTATWNNANNDTAVFVGTAGRVTLGESITVGGLLFNITGYTVSNSTYTLTFGATDNTITLNNVAAATISRAVGGTGNVTLTAANPATAGTVTFNATSAGGWSGTTTVNPNMTMLVDNNGPTNQVLLNTSAITLNGGAINVANVLSVHTSINFINDTAPITFNGGGSFTWRPVNANTFNENIGAVTNNSGQVSLLTASQSGPGIATLVTSGVTRNDDTSVLSFSTGNGGILAGHYSVNRIKVTGAGSTAGWATNMVGTPIIGPWATTGTSSADYAVYTNDYVAAAAGANAGESTWTDSSKAYTLDTGSAVTINTTRTITALRFLGAISTLTLGTGNLETYGLLFPGANAKTVASTGGGLTTPVGGGKLFITTVAAGHTISAPINDNSGAVTLVKSGGNQLTLSSTASTYSGGTVINAGTLATTANANLGSGGGIIVNGTAIWNAGAAVSVTYNRSLTINEGAVLTVTSGNALKTITGLLSGAGAIVNSATTTFDFTNTGNTFMGTVNNGYEMKFASLGDSSNPINLIGSNSRFTWTGGAKTFTLRPFTIQAAGIGIIDQNGTGALVIQKDLAIIGPAGARTLQLEGTSTGDNTFAGNITDGSSSVIFLTKADAGKWILSGTNTYSGATTISAGKLVGVVGGACSNSSVTVSGGTLGVSVTDTTQQWACAGLTHTAASTLEFAFGANTPSTTVAPLQVNGNVVFVLAPTVSCTGSSLPAGTYPLITWTGAFSGVAPSSLTLPSGTGLLVVDPATKTLWLSISASGGSKQPLTWKGPAGSTWVINEAVYTKWQDATPVNTNYQETTVSGITVGDNVVFGTTGAGTVTLNTTVSPASVSVNSTVNYTLSGTGSIAGPGGLTKASSGSLTLSTTNSYSGGTLLSAGTLSIGADNALGTGSLVLGAATIQSSDATGRTLNNPVFLNGNSTVGGTGNLTFNSSGTGTVIAASQITVSSSTVNATFGTSFGGAFGITKAGAGTMTLTGTNTYAGATTVSAGRLVVDGGQISHTAAAITVGGASMVITNGAKVFSGGAPSAIGTSGSGNPLKVVGGSGATSLWDLGNQHLGVGYVSGPTSFVIDGAGVAGSAVVTNINILQWGTASGFSTANTSILLTNGAQMYVNGDVRLGSTYYSSSAINNSIRIVGGAVDSTFYGKSGGAFYVGYGDRPNSSYNQVVVGSGGVLTNVGYHASNPENDFVIGWANTGSGSGTAYSNQLVVADGGRVFALRNLTVGWASGNDSYTRSNALLIANGGLVSAPGALYLGVSATGTGLTLGGFNGLTITSGGQLYTGANSIIGYAKANGQINISNTAWVSGANSLWNLGGKNLLVGSATGTGVATGNVLRVSSSGVATNISALIVSANNRLELGAGGQIYAGAVTNAGTLAVGLDKNVTPVSGRMDVTGNLNVNNARLDVSISGTPSGFHVIASYGSLTGTFAATNGLPDTYKLEMNYKGQNQVAIVYSATATLISFY